jgi:hypothetical protein
MVILFQNSLGNNPGGRDFLIAPDIATEAHRPRTNITAMRDIV